MLTLAFEPFFWRLADGHSAINVVNHTLVPVDERPVQRDAKVVYLDVVRVIKQPLRQFTTDE